MASDIVIASAVVVAVVVAVAVFVVAFCFTFDAGLTLVAFSGRLTQLLRS